MAYAAATICFGLGFIWQFGGWAAEWIGRAFGTRGLATTYDAFVGDFVTVLVTGGGIIRIVAPWILMGIGLLALAIVRLRN